MRVFAYCTALAESAVKAATGVEPITSPPMTAANFSPEWLEGHDLLYFRLHSLRNRGIKGWFGEGWSGLQFALSETQVLAADLGGAIVVVANCYGGDGDPMIAALYKAGARAVIAGKGPNVAAARRVVGTDMLVRWVIRGLEWRMPLEGALKLAQVRLLATAWRISDRDARQFEIVTRITGQDGSGGKNDEAT